MQEGQVTIGDQSYKLQPPFLVLATQNPIEFTGTYPLPEAQTDRFMMKVKIGYPDHDEEKEILKRMSYASTPPVAKAILTAEDILNARKIVEEIYIDEKVTDYILQVISCIKY